MRGSPQPDWCGRHDHASPYSRVGCKSARSKLCNPAKRLLDLTGDIADVKCFGQTLVSEVDAIGVLDFSTQTTEEAFACGAASQVPGVSSSVLVRIETVVRSQCSGGQPRVAVARK